MDRNVNKEKETREKRRGEREESERNQGKEAHHISTEPLLYVIHDRGLANGNLQGNVMDKQHHNKNIHRKKKKNKPNLNIKITEITRKAILKPNI